MANDHKDLRVIRTKRAVRDAFVALMNEKGFEAITVKDITNAANINRSTFYAHYQDKYDLINKCQEEVMKEIYSIVKQNLPEALSKVESNTTLPAPFPFAVTIFEYLHKNSCFMKAMLSPKGDLSFQIKFKKFIQKTLFEDNSNAIVTEKNLLVPKQYLTTYIASAHFGVIQQWLNSGMTESPQEMANILLTITLNGPFFAAGLRKAQTRD